MTTAHLYDRILAAVMLDGDDAAITFTTTLQPTGGPGTRISPPTYPTSGSYLKTTRQLGGDAPRETVLLDSYQSQSNRIEQALLEARDAGRIALPLFEMTVDADPWTVRLTSLDFPHRYADAYLRDSMINGVRFDKTEIGKALRVAEPSNAAALFHYDPVSELLGAWNSQRSGKQPKFARCYRSETIGLDPQIDVRRGGRLDPLNLIGIVDDKDKRESDWTYSPTGDKKKGGKLSEIGHGNALGGDASPGGVTISEARRLASLSFAALARLKFGDASATAAARTALAALALAGDRLAFGAAGWVFRSDCELTVVTDEIVWERRGGVTEPLQISITDALELFSFASERAKDAGLPISPDTVTIEPIPALRKAIEFAMVSAQNAED